MTSPSNVSIPIRYPLVLCYCVWLHATWAGMLMLDGSVGQITAAADLYRWFGSGLAPLLLMISVLALVPIVRSLRGLWPIVFLLPQQLILMISAGTAIAAMIESSFADGVVRPRAFIIADQTPAVLAAIFHSLAVVGNYWEPPSWVRR